MCDPPSDDGPIHSSIFRKENGIKDNVYEDWWFYSSSSAHWGWHELYKMRLEWIRQSIVCFSIQRIFCFFRNSFIVGSLFQCRETIEGRRVGQCCVWLLYNRLLQVFLVQHCFLQTLFRAMISTVNDKKVIIGHHIYAPVGFLDAVCSVLLKSYRVRSFEEGFDLQ